MYSRGAPVPKCVQSFLFMKVTLIITTYNRPDALESVLVSIYNLVRKPNQIIIADDGSTSETEKVIHKYQELIPIPLLHVWHPDEGFRVAEIRNKALAHVNSAYVIMIDGDMILDKYFIKDHLTFAKKGCFIQGKRCLLTDKQTNEILACPSLPFIAKWGDSGNEHRLEKRIFAFRSPLLCKLFKRDVKYKHHGIRSCNMALFYDDLVLVNGFNNSFTGWGREDSEIVERLFNLGIKRIDLPFSALAYHLHHKLESRASLSSNDSIFNQAISNKLKRCDDGLNRFLKPS